VEVLAADWDVGALQRVLREDGSGWHGLLGEQQAQVKGAVGLEPAVNARCAEAFWQCHCR
jgi:hypothetical protein